MFFKIKTLMLLVNQFIFYTISRFQKLFTYKILYSGIIFSDVSLYIWPSLVAECIEPEDNVFFACSYGIGNF